MRNSWLKWNAILIGIISVLVTFFVLFYTFTVKVPVGYTAIKVDIYWQNVEPKGLHTGRNFVNVITHDYFKYPVFIQQTEYSSLRFQDKSGLVVTADIGMDYKFDEAKIWSMYEQYKAWVDKITNTYMRTWVKNAINRASSEFEVDALYWPDKEKFRLKVLKNLQDDLNEKGIVVNNVYFVDEMELPLQVEARINAKIEATQKAMQKENELRAVEADAKKKEAEAKGIANAQIEKARWQAEARLIEAKSIATANKMINNSITPTLIDYNKAKSWDGKLPIYTGWPIPMLNVK